jgi:hypothetical protein
MMLELGILVSLVNASPQNDAEMYSAFAVNKDTVGLAKK